MVSPVPKLKQLLPLVERIANRPEDFSDVQSAPADILEDTTKSLFQIAKKNESKKSKALDMLFLEGFEQEQVWEQIQLLNSPVVSHIDKQLKTLLKRTAALVDEEPPAKKPKTNGPAKRIIEVQTAEDEESASEEEEEEKKKNKKSKEKKKGAGKPDTNDDERFTLDELDDFAEQDMEGDDELDDLLNQADDDYRGKDLDALGSSEEEEEEDEDEEEEDEDEDEDDEGEAMEEEEEEEEEGEGEDEDMEEGEEEEEGGVEEEGEAEEQNGHVDGDTVEKNAPKSRFETEMNQMMGKIKELEDAAVTPKAWTMVGEVSYKERPKNSLLEEDLLFDYAAKPAPVITQEYTVSLEDTIKKRIAKELWDDVARIKEAAVSTKVPVELDNVKNKSGLADVYEKEYLSQVHGQTEVDTKQEKLIDSIQDLFKKVTRSLDALSSFYHVPKPFIGEANVKANAPALMLEEITPSAVSTTSLVAPQEVYVASEHMQDKEEMSRKENQAHRRKMKERAKKAKLNAQATGKGVATGRGGSAAAAVKELNKEKRVQMIASSEPRQRSSSARFFGKLQEEQDAGGPRANTNILQKPVNSKSYKL